MSVKKESALCDVINHSIADGTEKIEPTAQYGVTDRTTEAGMKPEAGVHVPLGCQIQYQVKEDDISVKVERVDQSMDHFAEPLDQSFTQSVEPLDESTSQCAESLHKSTALCEHLKEGNVYVKKEPPWCEVHVTKHSTADGTVKLEPMSPYDVTDTTAVLENEPLQEVSRDICSDEQTRIEYINTPTNGPYPVGMFINKTSVNNEVNHEDSPTRAIEGQMRTHTGEKSYKCSFCPLQYASSSNLKTHMRGHTVEKTYKCSLCSYRSALESGMKRHTRAHTGEKPYKCSACPYRCAREDNLRRHIRTHTGEKPYKCSVCPYRSAEQSYLTAHIRRHTGEKPYKCYVCPYRSADRSNLKAHIRTHTREKPYKYKTYKCLFCRFRSADQGTIMEHMKNSHLYHKGSLCEMV